MSVGHCEMDTQISGVQSPTVRPLRKRVATALIVTVLVMVGVLVFGSPAKWIVAWSLSKSLGGPVSIESLEFDGVSSVLARGIVLRAPGWSGPKGEIARIPEARITLDLWTLLDRPIHIHSLIIPEIQVSVVEDLRGDGSLNIQALKGSRPASGPGSSAPPVRIDRLEIEHATVSMSRLVDGTLVEVGMRRFNASAEPGESGNTVVRAQELEAGSITGWVNQTSGAFEIRAEGVSWTPSTGLMLPSTARELVHRLEPRGQLLVGTVSGAPGQPLHASFDFRDVEVTLLDFGLSDDWVRYSHALIEHARGSPHLLLSRVHVEMDGELFRVSEAAGVIGSTAPDRTVVPLPFSGSMSLDLRGGGNAPFTWEDRVPWLTDLLSQAPMKIELNITDFAPSESDQQAVIELPRAAAEVLKLFGMTDWSITLALSAWRGAPPADGTKSAQPAPLFTKGSLSVERGSGAFHVFPYPLSDVKAHVTLEGHEATIGNLSGTSPSGARISITGAVHELGSQPGVDLEISGHSVPIDPTLLSCFQGGLRDALNTLFDPNAFASMRSAGLIQSPAEVTEARARYAKLLQLMDALAADPAADPAQLLVLAEEAGAMRRLSDEGSFQLGGLVGFSVRLHREIGPDQDVDASGYVTVENADALLTPFPLPLRVTGGTIDVRPDRIDLRPPGLSITTLDGGVGLVKGTIDIESDAGEPMFEPDLYLSVESNRISRRLWAAIPPEDAENPGSWPGAQLSQGGQLLDALALEGELDVQAHIFAGRDSEIDFQIDCALRDGWMQPQTELLEELGGGSLHWPTGLSLADCRAEVRITPDLIGLKSFSGTRGRGQVSAAGLLEPGDDRWSLRVGLQEMALEDYLLDLIPGPGLGLAQELWDRWQPHGDFDAVIHLDAEGDSSTAQVTIEPGRLNLRTPDGRIRFTATGGDLVMAGATVQCDGLTALIGEEGDPQRTSLCLDGAYGTTDGTLELIAQIGGGRLESPLIPEILHHIGAADALALWQSERPGGRFDADFTFRSGQDDDPNTYEFSARPITLALGQDSQRFEAQMADGGRVLMRNGSLEFVDLVGSFCGGEFAVDGWVDGTAAAAQALDLQASVRTWMPVEALLSAAPGGAEEVLRGMNLQWRSLELPDLQVASAGGGQPIRVAGTLTLHGAALNVGVPVRQLDAVVGIKAAAGSEESFDVTVATERFHAWELPFNHGQAAIFRKPGEALIQIDGPRATIGQGRIAGAGTVRTNSPGAWRYELTFQGVPLALLVGEVGATSEPGTLQGNVALCGSLDGLDRRQGVGQLTLQGAAIAASPLFMGLAHFTHLMLPLSSSFESANITFSLVDDNVKFENFDLQANAISFQGHGTMQLPGGEVALLFRPRGVVPVFSELFGTIADQVYQVYVHGTLQKPEVGVVPIPGLFGAGEVRLAPPIAGGGGFDHNAPLP